MSEELYRCLLVLAHGELSLAEVLAFLDDRKVEHSLLGASGETAVLTIPMANPGLLIRHLGGCHKIGRVMCSMPAATVTQPRELARHLDAASFYDELADKVNWAVSIYPAGQPQGRLAYSLEQYFSDRLKRDGVRKAKHLVRRRRLGPEEVHEVLSSELVRRRLLGEGFEVLAARIGDGFFFGFTVAVPDHAGFRKRDFARPIRLPIISMPPKLARLLVNLSRATVGGTLLDPFCGIGTILQEALVLGVDVRGVDISPRRVADTIANLQWLSRENRIAVSGLEQKIRVGDARKLSALFHEDSIDCIATEPILLPPFRAYPSSHRAKQMLAETGRIYRDALFEMRKVLKPSGRIAIVVPYVRTLEGQLLSFPMDPMVSHAHLGYYVPTQYPRLRYPLFERSKPDQKVIRGVYVMENQ